MTKILVIKPHPKWAYNAGEVGVVPTANADEMINAGYWQKVEDEKQANKANDTKRRRSNTSASKRSS